MTPLLSETAVSALVVSTPGVGGSVSTGAYTYLAHDHLGTSRKVYNQSQTEIHSNECLPFGQRFSTTGTVPYHEWTGKPWDAASQMYYFTYRYYSPIMNRWTAANPLGLVDGPNLYGYVVGNPIIHIDELGLSHDSCIELCEIQYDTCMTMGAVFLGACLQACTFGAGICYPVCIGLGVTFSVGCRRHKRNCLADCKKRKEKECEIHVSNLGEDFLHQPIHTQLVQGY